MVDPVKKGIQQDLRKLLSSLPSAAGKSPKSTQNVTQQFVVVETRWDWVDETPHIKRKALDFEESLKDTFGELMGEGNQPFRHNNTKESAWKIVHSALRRYDDIVKAGDPFRAAAVDIMRRFHRPL